MSHVFIVYVPSAVQVSILGFTTHNGTVAAADDWEEPVRHKRVEPSIKGVPPLSWQFSF